MSGLECTDPRVTKVCSELFILLTSGAKSGDVHHKDIKVRDHATGSRSAEIEIGFITLNMVWVPHRRIGGASKGSDEGANVFIKLPFVDAGEGTQAQISAYYSERGREPVLRANPPEGMRSKLYTGPRRIKYQSRVDTSPPI